MSSRCRSTISLTEKKYLPVLYDHCSSLFSSCHLPSHDHNHHLRVWLHARELLPCIDYVRYGFSSSDIIMLLLAVFFHDTGLTRTLDENHGRESRKLCQHFLSTHPELFPRNTKSALEAIELHDRKELYNQANKPSEVNILNILSLCDDLDACGAIGVLRYTEIYLLRGINFDDLPSRVLNNINYRLSFFSSQNWIPVSFSQKHKSRYRFSIKFFQEMKDGNRHKKTVNVKKKILESYMLEVYKNKGDLNVFAAKLITDQNPGVKEFATGLMNDLENGTIQKME